MTLPSWADAKPARKEELDKAFAKLDEKLEEFKETTLPDVAGDWEDVQGQRGDDVMKRRRKVIKLVEETTKAVEAARYKLEQEVDR